METLEALTLSIDNKAIEDIWSILKSDKRIRTLILSELLKEEIITISELVTLREKALLERIGEQKEEIAKGYALVLRYKEGINKKSLSSDAKEYLETSSYTGLGKYGK